MHPRKLRGRGRPSAPPTSALPLLDQLYPNSSVAASDRVPPTWSPVPEPNSAERQIETAQFPGSAAAYCTSPQTLLNCPTQSKL